MSFLKDQDAAASSASFFEIYILALIPVGSPSINPAPIELSAAGAAKTTMVKRRNTSTLLHFIEILLKRIVRQAVSRFNDF
jgi:hypothetical protein